jgi:opacity protein-like surface antigen
MHSICKIILPALLIISFGIQKSNAQNVPSDYEIGINAGTIIYQGDLSSGNFGYTKSLKPSFGLYGSKTLTDFFSVRANFMYGHLSADESTYSTPAYRQHRNLKFSTPIFESSVQLVWDLIGKNVRYEKHQLSPYLFIGAGISGVNISRNWSRFDTTYFNAKSSARIGLGVDTLHHLPNAIPVIPVGAGLRYMLTSKLSVNAEATYRITTTDYLDGFSYAANPKKKDHYYGLTLGISYHFGRDSQSCPKSPL